MSASFDFSGEVVLITGASGALGGAVADRFAEAGATVCGTSRSEPDDFPGDFYTGDFTDEADAGAVVDAVVADHGTVDHLLTVAGSWAGGDPVDETDVETFEAMVDVNLTTTFLAAKHALPALRDTEDRQGSLVTVASRSSLEGGEGDAAYRAAKAGVRLLTESIAAENVGEYGRTPSSRA